MMNRILGTLFVISLFFTSCKGQPNPKAWTEKYEAGLYNYLDSIGKFSIPDKDKRAKYVNFFIKRFKEEMPNGQNSISKDSLHRLALRINTEYGIKEHNEGTADADLVPRYTPWTPLIEKEFRDELFMVFQSQGSKMNNEYCDCYIGKLKKIYPDSVLLPTPKEINMKISLECKNKLDKN